MGRGAAPQAFAPGHFYSPVVDAASILREPDASRVWPASLADPPGVDLRREQQLVLLRRLAAHRLPLDHWSPAPPGYDPGNDQFPPQDAATLYALLRLLRPQRVLEVGCGWSTTVMGAAIADGSLPTTVTGIEPFPRPFLRELASVDGGFFRLREERVEQTPDALVDELGPGDVLFIDSSHVAKTGSDVVHELLHIVPRLADGVVVHVHDIFIPTDYPRGWVRNGFNWNEQYLLQAHLTGNPRAHTLLANHWLSLCHPDEVQAALGPVGLAGSSFWFAVGVVPPVLEAG
jgi:predicted O-methyltransferase YrrM